MRQVEAVNSAASAVEWPVVQDFGVGFGGEDFGSKFVEGPFELYMSTLVLSIKSFSIESENTSCSRNPNVLQFPLHHWMNALRTEKTLQSYSVT